MTFFLKETLDYTIYHFSDEEKVMKKRKLIENLSTTSYL